MQDETYDAKWMSALWGRIGSSVWSLLALVGVTITGMESTAVMEQGSALIQSGWAFAAQAGALLAAILPVVSRIRDKRFPGV